MKALERARSLPDRDELAAQTGRLYLRMLGSDRPELLEQP